MLIGYGRVSTEDQQTQAQREALSGAGCTIIFEEKASGGDRRRPELAEALRLLKRGDTLVVTRIDRLGRSLSHLLEVIETIRAKGGHFRSLSDPIDTSSPQGLFTLQVLGAAAEFERALVRERTKAGLASAAKQGRVGGNPGLKQRDPMAIAKIRAARAAGELARLEETAHLWMPTVERLRPLTPWPAVTKSVQRVDPEGRWSEAKLKRAVRRLVGANQAQARVLSPAPKAKAPKRDDLLDAVRLVLSATPTITLRELGQALTRAGHRSPSNLQDWSLATLSRLRKRALGSMAPL